MSRSDLSKIPSVDVLLKNDKTKEYITLYGRPLTLQAIRASLDALRNEADLQGFVLPEMDIILDRILHNLLSWTSPSLQAVINATGVVLHTNLGRSPISRSASQAMAEVAQGYSNLEYDLVKGKRGSRYTHTEDQLMRLTGAEAALVVNNNASALLLILSALARRRRVLISRTQLIEIGGGFRIPDVMKQSGAILEEIGATNRVHLSDYQKAIDELPIGLVLRAHRSNFKLSGFTSEPNMQEIAEITHQAGLILVDDLGSGTLLDTAQFGLDHETTVQEALTAGADLVCFSGDKLLGGPQAGIIIGKKDLINKLRKHPMARAIRTDKVALAGLSATLMHYLKDEAEKEIPIWQMISMDIEKIKERVETWIKEIGHGELVSGESAVGGGSLPGEHLPTYLLALNSPKPERFVKNLREQNPPIIARVQDGLVVFDPRTVLFQQEKEFLAALKNLL